MLHIYAALAEKQRRLISERTKAGLAAAKRRGVQLGGHNRKSDEIAADAAARAEALRPVFAELAGLTMRACAAELNARGIAAPKWRPMARAAGDQGARVAGLVTSDRLRSSAAALLAGLYCAAQ
jgi:DNA invertase Pin-like site-specific DNA recombinase